MRKNKIKNKRIAERKSGKKKKIRTLKKRRVGKSAPKKKFAKKSKSPKKKFKLDESLIGELIKRGRPRGFVTDTEILNYFPNIEKDISFLDA